MCHPDDDVDEDQNVDYDVVKMMLLLKLKMKTICQRCWKSFQWSIDVSPDDVEDALSPSPTAVVDVVVEYPSR